MIKENLTQCWHLAVWPGLAVARLANLAGQNGQKNLWPRPNANLLLINTSVLSFGQNLARVGHWPFGQFGRPNWPKKSLAAAKCQHCLNESLDCMFEIIFYIRWN